MGLMNLLSSKSEFEPEAQYLKPYVNLFERLEAIMAQAEKEGRDTWNISRERKLLADLKHAFHRANLPECNKIWQMMIAQNCLKPLWEQLHPDDETDELQLLAAVIHAEHLIKFWKSILECQSLVVGLRATTEAVEVVVPDREPCPPKENTNLDQAPGIHDDRGEWCRDPKPVAVKSRPGQDSPSDAPATPRRGWCKIHDIEMERISTPMACWWDHKLDDGTWCQGKAN